MQWEVETVSMLNQSVVTNLTGEVEGWESASVADSVRSLLAYEEDMNERKKASRPPKKNVI